MIDAIPPGFFVSVAFENQELQNQSTPNVEIWFPIVGHLRYLWRMADTNATKIIGQLVDLGDLRNSSTMVRDYLLHPGAAASAEFYCKVEMSDIERMRAITDKDGIVRLELRLIFSALYRAGAPGQKTNKFEPVYHFDISKAQMEAWMKTWTTSYAHFEELPESVPKAIVDDYIEATKSLNVDAWKASVVMSRRALQEALKDKGADKTLPLIEQIDRLRKTNVLDIASASLAHGVRQFGNFGAHPSNDLLSEVTADDAKLTLEVLKKILKTLYRAI